MPYMAAIHSGMGKVKTTIYLDDTEYRRLKRLAERERMSAAEMIRAAVSAYVGERDPGALPEWVGMLDAGPSLAESDEEELLEGFGES